MIVGGTWPPETFILRKIQGLAQNGVEVVYATPVPRRTKKPDRQGVKFFRMPHYKDSIVVRTLLFLKYLLLIISRFEWNLLAYLWEKSESRILRDRLYFILRSLSIAFFQPDVVHFEWNYAAIDYFHMKEIWKVPVVISCRGSQINVYTKQPKFESYQNGLKATFAEASAVHCVSNAIAQEAKKYGLEEDKVWIIHPAVDADFFSPSRSNSTRLNNKELKIISVGSLIPIKGYQYALDAIRNLVVEDLSVRYTIIGDGPEYQRILYAIRDLGLEKFVELMGRVSALQVRDRLRKSDVFLLPSLSEGISNALLEAMACGLPVIATDCGGICEVLTDNVEGLIVPVCDSNSISHSLRYLYKNRDLMNKMGDAGRKRVEQNFTLDQQSEKFLKLYSSLVRNSPDVFNDSFGVRE